MFASMILSISLMCGAQVVKATDEETDGSLNETGGILLKDTNANGQIDEVHITINYAAFIANDINQVAATATETGTIDKFTVTDTETANPVTISSIEFVSGDGEIAVFKLVLDETDVNLSVDTSETALDIVYTPTDTATDLEITDGTTPVSVEAIESDVVEKDGAAPVAISSVYKDTDSDETVDRIDVTYSENIEGSIFTATEWSFPTNPHSLVISSGTFSVTDVLIVVANAPTDSAVLESTAIKYTAGTGIVDGVGNYAVDAELPVSADEDIEEDEDDEEITLPDGADVGNPTTPNPNSGVTLYRVDGDPRVYVIKNKKKHWIKTPKEFEDADYNWSEIQEISAEIIEQYPDAETLVSDLLRAIGDHRVYRLEAGKKRWIKTLGEFNAAGHNWEDVQEVSSEVLASYQNVVVSDLLRAIGDHKVYKIKDGKKRWVKTLGEFNAAGHSWEDVQEVSAQDLDDYPDSDSEDV